MVTRKRSGTESVANLRLVDPQTGRPGRPDIAGSDHLDSGPANGRRLSNCPSGCNTNGDARHAKGEVELTY